MTFITLDDLFLHGLQKMLYAERKILNTLAKLECKATHHCLRQTFFFHLDETEDQIMRLENVFDLLGRIARGTQCYVILGLVEEVDARTANIDDPATLDAALISLARAIKQYEVTRYNTLVAQAQRLEQPIIEGILKQNLNEEFGATESFSRLAERHLNMPALA